MESIRRNVFNAGQCGEAFFELLVQTHIFGAGIATGRWARFRKHEMICLESDIHRVQFQQRPQKETGTTTSSVERAI